MTLEIPNPAPRLGALLSGLLAEPGCGYRIIDIGARGGAGGLWAPFAGFCDVIGFDPDEQECARLNAEPDNAHYRFYPYAVGMTDGRRDFHITQFPYSSGFYRGNPQWMDRFPFTTLKVRSTIQVDAVSLDTFAAREAVDRVDFIKVDVEGAELDVLRGAARMLAECGVMGIKTEFWWDPVIKGQPSFAELDTFLRQAGFRFFDAQLHRYPRQTLPAGRLDGRRKDDGHTEVALDPRPFGQAFTGDALYFRDPVGERIEGRTTISWTWDRLLRLCGLFDVFDYGDCAIEILEHFRDSLAEHCAVDEAIDLSTPLVAGQAVRYDEYAGISAQIRQMMNQKIYQLSDWQPPASGYRRDTSAKPPKR